MEVFSYVNVCVFFETVSTLGTSTENNYRSSSPVRLVAMKTLSQKVQDIVFNELA
jgi:hypothetical protein